MCRRRGSKEPSKAPKATSGCPLSHLSIVRLATTLLDANEHLRQFEVELGDRLTSEAVADELDARGCRVDRDPFKSLLVVTRPDSTKLPRAA